MKRGVSGSLKPGVGAWACLAFGEDFLMMGFMVSACACACERMEILVCAEGSMKRSGRWVVVL